MRYNCLTSAGNKIRILNSGARFKRSKQTCDFILFFEIIHLIFSVYIYICVLNAIICLYLRWYVSEPWNLPSVIDDACREQTKVDVQKKDCKSERKKVFLVIGKLIWDAEHSWVFLLNLRSVKAIFVALVNQ